MVDDHYFFEPAWSYSARITARAMPHKHYQSFYDSTTRLILERLKKNEAVVVMVENIYCS